ncbi:MAG TPA: glycerophosphoryl diester phosphodiesterase membrane domain-containing protein [Roseiflexaceae bacterium]|nr:glycerophosphoryl diester phosphodiesterase membrane domain-containing protein [Roseiflexaceae bacterium]
MGQTATADEALGAGRNRALSLIGGALLVGLLIAAALLPVIFALFFLFGSDSSAPLVLAVLVGVPLVVFVQVRLCLVFPAIVLEDSGAADAIGRSWRLTRGHGWRVLLTVIGLGLLTLLIQGSGQLIGVGTGRAGQIVLETCAQLLTLPLQAVVYVMVYDDLRVRDEGLDLEIRNAHPGLEV